MEFHRGSGSFLDCQVKEPKPDHQLVGVHAPLVDSVLGHPWTSWTHYEPDAEACWTSFFWHGHPCGWTCLNTSWHFIVASTQVLLCKPKLILSLSESWRNEVGVNCLPWAFPWGNSIILIRLWPRVCLGYSVWPLGGKSPAVILGHKRESRRRLQKWKREGERECVCVCVCVWPSLFNHGAWWW